MDTINKNGIYEIKGIPGKILHRVDDSLQLLMRRTSNDQDRNSFSLEELKELQSKLVLVAAENADGVNKFIEVHTVDDSHTEMPSLLQGCSKTTVR